ncbi:DnaD domain protein, partial [Staphylococcus aureus]
MNKLLIDDYPIQVLPKLAELIGLNEAIVLQQIHYWLNNSKHKYDGKTWIFNSYPEWQKQFPFWSERTIKRTFGSLEKQNLLHVDNYNKAGFDRTKWYSINYETLNKLVARPSGQNGPTMRTNWHDARGQNDPTNTIDYTETNKHRETDDVSMSFKYISNNLEIIQTPLKAEQLEHEIKSFKKDPFEIVKVATDYCKENNK